MGHQASDGRPNGAEVDLHEGRDLNMPVGAALQPQQHFDSSRGGRGERMGSGGPSAVDLSLNGTAAGKQDAAKANAQGVELLDKDPSRPPAGAALTSRCHKQPARSSATSLAAGSMTAREPPRQTDWRAGLESSAERCDRDRKYSDGAGAGADHQECRRSLSAALAFEVV
eukprot:CAMPEP_0183417976 /NCGR_PEP_ID=MMETSP0370-20130417/24800_1 /TAXON_ID=268820 /ORGANISM="Peridinium aciculiferum, Strain PAER-2" /LENGTH=169 /DNA_ID=CAMNT_0025601621 /DNA_START=82 /DNA_END=588 /DNA_ORIENTATION=+